ncbi:alkylation response protein AidB-like acyl-CoA dehydrogenase [Nocardioides thalensis]|uniref:Alkylation response protein AidB-like acyl-CoA dehydrogenase n=1 Tax=Nocardioides thalensis TaxID=1914755 RepID=A0A853BVX6_9ACTN|nr:acyl-CoA dehydrogenase [Nocardioides thalensis]NYJ00040.1 alkylation response protein AidB-like acyl-CoA dehydrogenase [Nocardioides thalensis]
MTTDTSPTRVTPVTRPGTPEWRALLDRIAEGASERERDKTPPHEVIGWLKEAGTGRLRLPVKDGGAGLSIPELFSALIDLAEADSSVPHILRTHYWFVEQHLQGADDPAFRTRLLELAGKDLFVGNGFSEQSKRPVGLYFDTAFTPDPAGGYRLNGTKYYSTGSIYSDYTQIWAAAPEGRIAGAVIPVDREGVSILDDWDGFGQRLTGTGTTHLQDVRVAEEEFFDLGEPDGEPVPGYQGAFLQLFLQAVTAGILRNVRNDAVALVKRRARNYSHANAPQSPAEDPQVLQVVGEIAADAFAAEAIVLRAAEALQVAADSVVDGVPGKDEAAAAQRAAAEAKVAVDRFSYATAARLFDVGGTSATQAAYNLDRHWRNVRTISTHNPTFLKASSLGANFVHGTPFPANAYF